MILPLACRPDRQHTNEVGARVGEGGGFGRRPKMGDAAAGGGGSSGRPRHATSIVRCDSGEWSALVQSTTDAVGDGGVASRRREALLPPKVEYLQPQPKAHEMASKAQSYADRVKVEDSPRPLDVLLQPKAAKAEPANPNHHLHSVDDLFSFAGFSTMLEALPDKPQAERAKLVQGFWKVVDAALQQRLKSDDVKTADAAVVHRADYHPFLRLLLPHLDGRRSTYGLKESKIAQCYAKILRIPAESADAQRLTKWKDPSKSSAAATSFSDVLYTVLVKRGFREVVRKEGEAAPTIRDVNALLDELSHADSPARKNAVLTRVVRGFNALEQKWLTRVITKDMKLGVSHATVLSRLHPSAMQVLNTTTDLVHVCRVCAFAEAASDADAEGGGGGGGGGARGGAGAELALNQAFNPMLAALVTQDRLASALASGPYWVEPKYDGERILIHFSVVSGADGGRREYSVKFLTRNSKDYTTLYGPKFSSVVIDALKGQVREDCILDGELLVYDAAAGTFKQFGHNKTFALDFASGGQGQQQGCNDTFCYMAFDVVFLNGAPLTAVPLAQRREALLKLVRPTRNQIEVVPLLSQRVAGVREVLAALDEAVCTASYEGIILKLTTSLYTPGERKLRWLKLKRDHVEGLADTLDLVVVGAYHGTKFGRKGLSHFLLAVYKRGSDDDEGGGEGRWETFTKVGTGYDRQELDVINRSLEGKLLPYAPGGAAVGNVHNDPLYHPDSRSAADVVLLRKKLFGAWRPAADDVPDVFLHPACVQRSVVLEVIGYAFTETIKFAVGKTVRFPRVRRLRTDKTPADATDYDQLVRIMEAGAEGRRLAVDLHRPTQGEGGGGAGGAQPRARRRRLLGGAGGASADGEAPANYVQRQRLMLLGSYVGGSEAASGEGGSEGGGGTGEGGDVDERLRTRSAALCVRGEPLALCVLQCEQTEGWSKELLQTLVRHHGGAAPANPTKDCFLVASSASAAKVKHWRDAVERGDAAVQGYRNKYVLHHSWVVDSIKARRPLPCAPRYMVYTSPDLRERFSKTIDAHGDTYFLPATLASLQQILTDAFPPPPPAPASPASPAGAQAGKRRKVGRAETEAAEAAASLARFAALSAASLRTLRARRALGLPAAPSLSPPPPSRGGGGGGLFATAFAGHVVAYSEASLCLGGSGVEDTEGEASGGGSGGGGGMRLALLEAAHRGALVVRVEDVVGAGGGGDDAACRTEEEDDDDDAACGPRMTLVVGGTEPRSEMVALAARCAAALAGGAGRVSVARCAWILDSVAAGVLLPAASYAVGVADAPPAAAAIGAAADPPPAAKRRRVDDGGLGVAAATAAPAQKRAASGGVGVGALSPHDTAVLSTRRPVGDGVSFGAVPDLSNSVEGGFDGDEDDEEDDACGKPSAFMISHLQSLGPSVAAAAAAATEAPEELGVAGMLMESDGPLATGDTQF